MEAAARGERTTTARSDDPGVSPGTSAAAGGEIWGTWEKLLLACAGEIWGTWEKLLLACAVRKHGTFSWDAVAMEMLSRCPPAAAEGLTPAGCRLRYCLLHRRFAAAGDDEDPDAASADGCVESLRKLRVAELRREVERHHLSIGSLQSKVERLKEERERSISGAGNPPPAVKEHLRRGQSTTGGIPLGHHPHRLPGRHPPATAAERLQLSAPDATAAAKTRTRENTPASPPPPLPPRVAVTAAGTPV